MMTMLERYGRRYPCVLDADIFGKMPTECKDYLAAYDFFLYYDDDGKITLASWDTEDTFESIDALTAHVKEEMRLAEEALGGDKCIDFSNWYSTDYETFEDFLVDVGIFDYEVDEVGGYIL